MRERPRFTILCIVCRERCRLAPVVQEMAPQINAFREAHQHGAPGLNIRIEPAVTLMLPEPRAEKVAGSLLSAG